MVIVCKYGKPDLFLTYLCNPNCPEITETLNYQKPTENRPELIARVYKSHNNELMVGIADRLILNM